MLPLWAMMLVIQSACSQRMAGQHAGGWQSLTAKGTPAARSGHSAVWVDGIKGMLLFGGSAGGHIFIDLHLFLANTTEWKELNSDGDGTSGLMQHSAVWVDMLGMLVFGGLKCAQCYATNDLYLYVLGTNTWQELSPNGSVPVRRSSHSAVWVDQLKGMLIFGGVTFNATRVWFLNDLHLYIPETNEWQELSPNSAVPQARSQHSAVWIEKLKGMLIFGGEFCPDLLSDLQSQTFNCEYFNDLHLGGETSHKSLDFLRFWEMGLPGCFYPLKIQFLARDQQPPRHLYVPKTNEWQELQPSSGKMPPERSRHSAIWVDALNGMLVFGGQSCEGSVCEKFVDIWFFDPETKLWVCELLIIQNANGLAGHSTVWIEGVNETKTRANGTLLFGGMEDGWSAGEITYRNELQLWNFYFKDLYINYGYVYDEGSEETTSSTPLGHYDYGYSTGNDGSTGDGDGSGSPGLVAPGLASLLLSMWL